jgi:hypothetical protein
VIRTLILGTTLCVALFAWNAAAADDKTQTPAPSADAMTNCPMHAQHMAAQKQQTADGSAAHGHDVDARHDTFGMPHSASTHSFRLFPDGGAIELRATSADDDATVTMIRKHLEEITTEFVKGDFATPAFVHGKTPNGVREMAQLGDELSYRYESLPAGGRIRIQATSTAALAAVHDFLRFQVIEHRTNDSGKVEEDKDEVAPATGQSTASGAHH